MDNFRAGILIGILWMIGLLGITKLDSIITNGEYASGLGILLMMIWLVGLIGIFVSGSYNKQEDSK